ncbi:MAG: hypothetical protein H7843_15985 [Nitrospirota bacterium]
MLIVTSVVFSPEAGFSAKCKNNFYIISLKNSYLKKKYKVRAFFLNPGIRFYIYGINKMPKGWLYDFPDEHGFDSLIGTADTDKDAVDIGYFKDFFTFILLTDNHLGLKPDLSMTLYCNKSDGTAKILELKTKDFKIKRIYKCLKWY